MNEKDVVFLWFAGICFCDNNVDKCHAELSLIAIVHCLYFLMRHTQRHEISRSFGKVFGQGE